MDILNLLCFDVLLKPVEYSTLDNPNEPLNLDFVKPL